METTEHVPRSRWSVLRWLLLLVPLPVATAVLGIAALISHALLQYPYFQFVDTLHRATSRETDGFGILLFVAPVGLIAFGVVIGAALAAISKGSRAYVLPVTLLFALFGSEAVIIAFESIRHPFGRSGLILGAAVLVVQVAVTAILVRAAGGGRAFRKVVGVGVLVGYFIFCLVTIFTNSVPEPTIRTLKPVWKADLKPFGWSAWRNEDQFSATRRITFIDSGTLAVGYEGDAYYESKTSTSPKYPQHVLTLDAATGRVLAHKDWVGGDSYVVGTANGALLILSGNVERVSATLKPLGAFQVTNGRALYASHDGTRIAWERLTKTEPGIVLIDADTLKPVLSLDQQVISTVSSNAIASNNVWTTRSRAVEVYTERAAWTLYESGPQDCGEIFPDYLTNGIMLVTVCDHALLFDTTRRQLLARRLIGLKMLFAGVARDGTRFALASSRWDFGDPSYINKEEITVYDTATFRPVAKVVSEPLPEFESWSALSPDGHYLATGSGGVVKMFRID